MKLTILTSALAIVKNFITSFPNLGEVQSVETTIFSEITLGMQTGPPAQIKMLSPGVLGVYWSVADFESQAEQNKGKYWRAFYDEKEFYGALESMMSNHDANLGITWHTVETYLDDCKIADL
tara:strand:+ start:51692 stop:52057 length:366 start_codon:yes stop_codon:yes gene_type:complete